MGKHYISYYLSHYVNSVPTECLQLFIVLNFIAALLIISANTVNSTFNIQPDNTHDGEQHFQPTCNSSIHLNTNPATATMVQKLMVL